MKHYLLESDLQRAVMDQLRDHGWVAREVVGAGTIVDTDTLKRAVKRINPNLKAQQVTRVIDWVKSSTNLHAAFLNGLTVPTGKRRDAVRLIDEVDPSNNEFHVIEELTMQNQDNTRRVDLILTINGLPIVMIELKSPSRNENALVHAAQQLVHYQMDFSAAQLAPLMSVVSDGLNVWVAGNNPRSAAHFHEWDKDFDQFFGPHGDLTPKNLLQALSTHILSNQRGDTIIVAPHQRAAVNRIKDALAAPTKDHRLGVVWHSQGAGKSITMLLTAITAVRDRAPGTLVLIITDRLDLEDQLRAEFRDYAHLIPARVQQVSSMRALRDLKDASGIAFCTIQKFHPNDPEPLSVITDRENILILVDEAHRNHTGFETHADTLGYHHRLRTAFPKAQLLGFTATPTSTRNGTTATFGKVLHSFTIDESVQRRVTLPVVIHTRPVTITTKRDELHSLQTAIDSLPLTNRERGKFAERWSNVTAVMLTRERIRLVAQDIVRTHEARSRDGGGKAIVFCMNRHHCVLLHDAISEIRPEWIHEEDHLGRAKVLITGTAGDTPELRKHARNVTRRSSILDAAKTVTSPIDLLISCDLLTTGFNAPAFDTIYNDKVMRGHTLLQAFTRVNRRHASKTHGAVFDYAGVTVYAREAMSNAGVRGAGDGLVIANDVQAAFLRALKTAHRMLPLMPSVPEGFAAKLQGIKHAVRHLQTQRTANEFLRITDEIQVRYRRHRRLVQLDDKLPLMQFLVTVAHALARVTPEEHQRSLEHDHVARVGLNAALTASVLAGESIECSFGHLDVLRSGDAATVQVNANPHVHAGERNPSPYGDRLTESVNAYNRSVLAPRRFVMRLNIPNIHTVTRNAA